MISLLSARKLVPRGSLAHRIGFSSALSSTPQQPPQQPPFVLFYNDNFKVELPEQHKFPMQKYALIRAELQKLLASSPVLFHQSPLATEQELETTHCPEYIARFIHGRMTAAEQRVVGFPWSEQIVQRSLSSVGGTLAATRNVLNRTKDASSSSPKRWAASAHLAGGTHHAFFDRGEGYCVWNDIAVAANCALLEFPQVVRRVLVVDCDVHSGNGTARLFASDSRVFTFDMYCEANVFSKLETSDISVVLDAGCSGEEYLHRLRDWLPFLFETAQPDIVFFQAGVDVLVHDRLGKLNLTRGHIRERNLSVYEAAFAHGVPLVVTMGGGYPKDINPNSEAFKETIGAHVDVYEGLVKFWETTRSS
jgi:acetoin utilization deacetylase AcuC-like enzyme